VWWREVRREGGREGGRGGCTTKEWKGVLALMDAPCAVEGVKEGGREGGKGAL